MRKLQMGHYNDLLNEPTTLEQGWVLRTIQLPDSLLSADCYIAFEGQAEFGWAFALIALW